MSIIGAPLFNNDVQLWENSRKSSDFPDGLLVVDGHVFADREVFARCADTKSANKMLRDAGWKQRGGRFWKKIK